MTRPSAPVVLVVTRHPEEGEALCSELRIAGKRALFAAGGRDALQLAASQPPSLVVQDVVLPDMDGATMIAALRQLPGLDAVPAVALASSPPARTARDRETQGFQELLIKPVDPDVLFAAAGNLLAPEPDLGGGARGRILLADDNAAQRRLMSLRLGHAGYEVIAVPDGVEALRLARAEQPDAVVSDVLMPGIDGFELTRALRSDARTRAIPVVLTSSAFVDPDDEALAAAVGASSLVARTPDLAELLSAIDACLLSARDAQQRTQDPVARRVVEQRFGERMAVHLDHEIQVNADLREQLAAQSVELAVLAGLGGEISAGGGAEQLLEEVLARCAEVTGFGCGAVYLFAHPSGGGDPVLQGRVGFAEAEPLRDFFGCPELLLEAIDVAGSGTARLLSEQFDDERSRLVLRRAGLSVILISPIADAEKLLGVLVLGSPRGATTSDQEAFIAAVAAHLGQSLSRVQALYALSRSQRRMVERLTRAAEFRGEESANHVQRVSRYAALLASRSGVDESQAELIAAGSMMHDIGKLGIPDTILRKPGRLTDDERTYIRRHAEYGRQILAGEPDTLLDIGASIAWTHHERWDGTGYPRGLRGEEIPLEGRIVAICEVFDALTSNRVYRPAMSVEEALDVMRSGMGTQFDPTLLATFLGALPRVLEIRARHPDVATGGQLIEGAALRA